MEKRGRAVYSISAVARMVGVPVATIRTWEDRYHVVVPGAERERPPAVSPRSGRAAQVREELHGRWR